MARFLASLIVIGMEFGAISAQPAHMEIVLSTGETLQGFTVDSLLTGSVNLADQNHIRTVPLTQIQHVRMSGNTKAGIGGFAGAVSGLLLGLFMVETEMGGPSVLFKVPLLGAITGGAVGALIRHQRRYDLSGLSVSEKHDLFLSMIGQDAESPVAAWPDHRKPGFVIGGGVGLGGFYSDHESTSQHAFCVPTNFHIGYAPASRDGRLAWVFSVGTAFFIYNNKVYIHQVTGPGIHYYENAMAPGFFASLVTGVGYIDEFHDSGSQSYSSLGLDASFGREVSQHLTVQVGLMYTRTGVSTGVPFGNPSSGWNNLTIKTMVSIAGY
jgi:outer membrane lipoprotein SlyB